MHICGVRLVVVRACGTLSHSSFVRVGICVFLYIFFMSHSSDSQSCDRHSVFVSRHDPLCACSRSCCNNALMYCTALHCTVQLPCQATIPHCSPMVSLVPASHSPWLEVMASTVGLCLELSDCSFFCLGETRSGFVCTHPQQSQWQVCEEIFSRCDTLKAEGKIEYEVIMTMVQIYMEKLSDLLVSSRQEQV